MSLTTVIVDDYDAAIVYSPPSGWSRVQGDISSPFQMYNNTLTAISLTTTGTATFKFTGTSVTVSGWVDGLAGNGLAGLNQSLTFEVDSAAVKGIYPPAGSSSDNQAIYTQFFVSPTLADTAHTLTITSDIIGDDAGNILIDFITYTASPNTQITEGLLYVEGSDSKSIQYGAGWTADNSDGYDAVIGMSSSGDNVNFTFPFEGTSVSWFGDAGSLTANGTITIDNNTPTFFVPPQNDEHPNTAVYSSGNLDSGSHKLSFQALTSDSFDVWYFVVTPPTPGTSSSTSTSASVSHSGTAAGPSSTQSHQSTLATVAGSSTSGTVLPATTSSTASVSQHHMATGAMAGIGIGVAVVLLLLAFLAWWQIRKRRARSRFSLYSETPVLGDDISPRPVVAEVRPFMSASGSTFNSTPASSYRSDSKGQLLRSGSEVASSSARASSAASPNNFEPEIDAGPVNTRPPPVYDERWMS